MMMISSHVSLKLVSVLLVSGLCHASLRSWTPRGLQTLLYERIAGYEPMSLVTDHNAIDLDQKEIQNQLAIDTNSSWEQAWKIYKYGAFSKSVANITLKDKLINPLPSGLLLIGSGKHGGEVRGTLFNNAFKDETVLRVQYETSSDQINYVGCQVGANPRPNTDRCFVASGKILISNYGDVEYSYDVLGDNANERKIQGFSTSGKEKMSDCANCPYVDFVKFLDYYGHHDYGDRWVSAAWDRNKTDLKNGVADFSKYGKEGRTEAIQKGTAYMIIWMYVIQEMEGALDVCKEGCDTYKCNDDSVNTWDAAVAFYTGSMEGPEGQGNGVQGVLLHALADKRCIDFATCGQLGRAPIGTAFVNLEILRQFLDGQRKLSIGDCDAAREVKQRIVQMMTVPLIQGTLRYGYITSTSKPVRERDEAEGATFAAAVLPMINACNPSDAQKIYNNMQVGKSGANFAEVKEAFERNYECLGITCADVGGVFDIFDSSYRDGAEPCDGAGRVDKSAIDVVLAVGLSMGGLAMLGIAVYIYVFFIGDSKQEERCVLIEVQDEAKPEGMEEIGEEQVPVMSDPRKRESQSGLV